MDENTTLYRCTDILRSASGLPLAITRAVRGDNLISWDVAPVNGRPRYASTSVRWYDPKSATWKTEEAEIDDPGAVADFLGRFAAADEQEAKRSAESARLDSERGRGGGSITIDGTATPQPEGIVILVGARPGIDGAYRIDTVQHELSRSGWTTRLDVKQPQNGAGTDSRAASA